MTERGEPRRSEAHERAACIDKWIQVADECRLVRNLNGVLEVCAALMNSAVFRLKLSWERVSKQVRLRLQSQVAVRLAFARTFSFACRSRCRMPEVTADLLFPLPLPLPLVEAGAREAGGLFFREPLQFAPRGIAQVRLRVRSWHSRLFEDKDSRALN